MRHLHVGKRRVRKPAASVGEHQIGRQHFRFAVSSENWPDDSMQARLSGLATIRSWIR